MLRLLLQLRLHWPISQGCPNRASSLIVQSASASIYLSRFFHCDDLKANLLQNYRTSAPSMRMAHEQRIGSLVHTDYESSSASRVSDKARRGITITQKMGQVQPCLIKPKELDGAWPRSLHLHFDGLSGGSSHLTLPVPLISFSQSGCRLCARKRNRRSKSEISEITGNISPGRQSLCRQAKDYRFCDPVDCKFFGWVFQSSLFGAI
jgi:hypothetical protein